MGDDKREQALAEEILADARRQAERKLDRAQKQAARIVRSAAAKAEPLERDALDAARKTLDRRVAKILADLPLQKQLRTLQVEDDVIERLFQESLDALTSRDGFGVGAVLARLAADGIGALPGDRFVLEVGKADADALGEAFAGQVAAALRAAHERQVTVEIKASDAMPEGGVIVRSADGRQMVDHSFPTRMRRARPSLRGQIAKTIFGERPE